MGQLLGCSISARSLEPAWENIVADGRRFFGVAGEVLNRAQPDDAPGFGLSGLDKLDQRAVQYQPAPRLNAHAAHGVP